MVWCRCGRRNHFLPEEARLTCSDFTQIPVGYQDISVVVNGSSTVAPKDSYTVIGLVKG